jgi:hypothetical protein
MRAREIDASVNLPPALIVVDFVTRSLSRWRKYSRKIKRKTYKQILRRIPTKEQKRKKNLTANSHRSPPGVRSHFGVPPLLSFPGVPSGPTVPTFVNRLSPAPLLLCTSLLARRTASPTSPGGRVLSTRVSARSMSCGSSDTDGPDGAGALDRTDSRCEISPKR